MPDELEELARETIESIPLKVRIMGVSPGDLLAAGVSLDDLVATFSPESRLKGLSADELLAALSPKHEPHWPSS
jgi:hypothetical protein